MKKIINSKKDINYLSIINQIMPLLIKLKKYLHKLHIFNNNKI